MALVQNGEQRHYMVQEKMMGDDLNPTLFLNELVDEEIRSFSDLPPKRCKRYESGAELSGEGFETREHDSEMDVVNLISQSSLNTFVRSPKEYLFDEVVEEPDQSQLRKGKLYHHYAEFYANYPEIVEKRGRGLFVEIMLQEIAPIVDELALDTLETEFEIGLRNIETFVDNNLDKDTNIDGYQYTEKLDNMFSDRLNKEEKSEYTEMWFEDGDLGVKGYVDLIATGRHLIDYKSGSTDSKMSGSAYKLVSNSNPEILDDKGNFQAILYLTYLRDINSDQKLEFTFFHFLDNIEDEMSAQADNQDNAVTVTYYPKKFNELLMTDELIEFILDSSKSEGKVSKKNNRRKVIETRASREHFIQFFEGRSLEQQLDKEKALESKLLRDMIRHYERKIGDHNYVEEGCESIIKNIVDFRKENYFKQDLDNFEEFVDTQLGLLNQYRTEGFPLQNPETDSTEFRDLRKTDLIHR